MRLDHLLSKELNYCLVGHAARECRVGGLLMGGMSAPFFLLFVLFHGVVYTSSSFRVVRVRSWVFGLHARCGLNW